jgi:hypothetical protein
MPDDNILNVVMGIAVDAKELQEMKDFRNILKDIKEYQDDISKGILPSFSKSGTVTLGSDTKRIESDLDAIDKKTSTDSTEVKKGITTSIAINQQNTADILNTVNNVQSNIYIKVAELTNRFNASMHTNVTQREKERFIKEELTPERALKTANVASSKYLRNEAKKYLGLPESASRQEFNEVLSKVIYSTAGEVEGKDTDKLYRLLMDMEEKGINIGENLQPMLNIAGETNRTLRGFGMSVGNTKYGNEDLTFASSYESLGKVKAGQSDFALGTWNKIRKNLPKKSKELSLPAGLVAQSMQAKDVSDIEAMLPDYGLTPESFNMAKGGYVASQGASKYLYEMQGLQSKDFLSSAGIDLKTYNEANTSDFSDVIITAVPKMVERLRKASEAGLVFQELVAVDKKFENVPDINRQYVIDMVNKMLEATTDGAYGIFIRELKKTLPELSNVGSKYSEAIGKGYLEAGTVGPIKLDENIPNLNVPEIKRLQVSSQTTGKDLMEGIYEPFRKSLEDVQQVMSVAQGTGGSQELISAIKELTSKMSNLASVKIIAGLVAKLSDIDPVKTANEIMSKKGK